ncbi:MAG TPA: signal recognition particle protein [Clostridia bacterium]|nr:signal recognition particle protein [Clostridia bacterium]
MAFESLSERLQGILKRLRGKGKLSPQDVEAATKEVKIALLEADVNFKVVKDFIARVKERATGAEVMESLTPAQQVIKIVHSELTALLGGVNQRLSVASRPPSVYVLMGLQGSGKTTTCAKLGRLLSRQGRRPILVAADLARPAAVKQLEVLANNLGLPSFADQTAKDPVAVSEAAVADAVKRGIDAVLIDTAGRLHIDDELMEELKALVDRVHPTERLLVVDSMMGQDAVKVAEIFADRIGIDGLIMTKLDGDARGGAALSVKAVTGVPIKFVGMGEHPDALEPFYPDRMASRILGMGDVLTLIEKAERTISEREARELERKIRENEFTLEDFLGELKRLKNMGPLDQLLGMIPGFGKIKELGSFDVGERELSRIEAIISSMTREERRKPWIIDGSRRKRIAMGSGTRIQDVNRLLRQYWEIDRMMKQFGGKKGSRKKGVFRGFPSPFGNA